MSSSANSWLIFWRSSFFFPSERMLTFSNNSRLDKSSEEHHFYTRKTHMTCILQSDVALKEANIGLGWGLKAGKAIFLDL